jgi:transposase
LIERGIPDVWRRSIAEAVAVVTVLDARLIPLEAELRRLARADARVRLLVRIPGVGDLLGLTIASEIGEISRFASTRKLIGYSGLTPRVYQSGQKARTGKLSNPGSTMLRRAAIEAAQRAWRPNNPWHPLYLDVKQGCGGKSNPARAAVHTSRHAPRPRGQHGRTGRGSSPCAATVDDEAPRSRRPGRWARCNSVQAVAS